MPDTELYPEFDENLRDAMEQETKLFVGSQLHDDRSVAGAADRRLLVPERAAGDALRDSQRLRQPFPARARSPTAARGGLLGQASMLTVTSYPNRTSVAMRGRWLLANLLGAPPPPPPPDVPALKEAGADGQPRSLRERMEVHREESGVRVVPSADGSARLCAREFRRRSGNGARSATARRSIRRRRCPTARASRASTGLRTLLVSHKEDFVRTLSGKLLAYAIGRGLDYHDRPPSARSRAMRRRADYSWSSIITRHRQEHAVQHGSGRTARSRQHSRR